MVVENVMYFVLGLLVAGLLALAIVPAVWRRAVRLTKKRIEAATPMSMAEFRADKDQLRAEFALSTRRLEMNVEALRRRLADQLRDINRKKGELGGMKDEREQHLQVVRELEEREAELRRRVLELEKESVDLAQKLKLRDAEYASTVSQLEQARAATPQQIRDLNDALQRLEIEQKRSEFLEQQNRALIQQLEKSDRRAGESTAEAANLREQLAKTDNAITESSNELVAAEARIADAESRVSTLLAETARTVENGERQQELLLAEQLRLEEELEKLREKVAGVESAIMADWNGERLEQSHLRERLNDIASDVSRIVYALDGNGMPENEESLFDRVQKFVDGDPAETPAVTPRPAREENPHAVSDRLKALRELQEGG